MRDPARIEPMLAAIRDLWYANPDWRLGQLVVNASRPRMDPFHVEDDAMLDGIRDLMTGADS